jgi:hypothetical protein
METAMDVLTRALQGDAGAQRFLDQTASIYVLDATRQTSVTTNTTMTAPKLFGCWNFLHQALNEMENNGIMIHHHNNNDNDNDDHNNNNNKNNNKEACQQQQLQQQLQLLLAQFAVKVARRSNQWDQHLVRTCMENYINTNTTDHRPSLPSLLSSLIPDNAQLREIVMGRIAALALDPNNHQQGIVVSNYTSLQTFHQSIAANAVSNSPGGIRHLLLDWIIPSQQQLPPYSWVCLVQCVAQEVDYQSSSSSSLLWTPAGTRATLQQCSASVCTQLLGPVLQQTISNSNHNNHNSNYEEQEDIISDTSTSTSTSTLQQQQQQQQQQQHVIAATALRALQAWCQATDLSVAQVQHLCSKVKVSVCESVYVVCVCVYTQYFCCIYYIQQHNNTLLLKIRV